MGLVITPIVIIFMAQFFVKLAIYFLFLNQRYQQEHYKNNQTELTKGIKLKVAAIPDPINN